MTEVVGEFENRRQRLRAFWKDARVDAMLITALPNVRYLSGFTGSSAMLLLTAEREMLFTDPRYQTQAPRESDCEVKVAKGPLTTEVLKWAKRLRIRKLGFEEARIGFLQFQRLKEKPGPATASGRGRPGEIADSEVASRIGCDQGVRRS